MFTHQFYHYQREGEFNTGGGANLVPPYHGSLDHKMRGYILTRTSRVTKTVSSARHYLPYLTTREYELRKRFFYYYCTLMHIRTKIQICAI